MVKKSILLLCCLGMQLAVHAQPGWNWPQDTAKAKEYYALFSDYIKIGKAAEALPYLEWLLAESPNLNVALYIGASKTYEELADAETDAGKKTTLQEKALSMYDERIKYFNSEGEVLNRKAFTAYKYYKDNPSKYPELIALFEKSSRQNGTATLDNNLIAFMDVLKRHKTSGGQITDEKVLEYYYDITDIIEAKLAESYSERLVVIAEKVDQLLAGTIKLECSFIETTLGPRMRQDTSGVKMAKKVFHLLLTGKCLDSPLSVESALVVHEKEPSYGFARIIAAKKASAGDNEAALKYYAQAITLTEEKEKKAANYLDMARIYTALGEKSQARTHARNALNADPSLSDAFNLIGSMYYGSYEDCKKGESRVKDRAVFIAAYEMYRKGGNVQGMESAKSQFPSIEEIFEEGLKEGQNVTVGCWVQESVSIQRR